MQPTIQHIKKELGGLYPAEELEAFTRLLFYEFCGMSYTDLAVRKNETIDKECRHKIDDAIERLKRFEPIQYIAGRTSFYGLNFEVNPSVLIPRPETEELVDWIVRSTEQRSLRILDIGTGSGCIAVALKSTLPETTVTAIDISSQALETATRNALHNELEVKFVLADLLKLNELDGAPFNLMVSNPPYVRESEKKWMHQNVLEFEPWTALFVPDNDPLLFYKALAKAAQKLLTPYGWLYLEINENLGDEVLVLFTESGFKNPLLKKDIRGKYRFFRCRKSGNHQ